MSDDGRWNSDGPLRSRVSVGIISIAAVFSRKKMSVNLPQRVSCEISARREERETGKKLPGFNICCHDSAIEDILRFSGQATAQLNVIGPRKREKKTSTD